jgi:hypothetical protein
MENAKQFFWLKSVNRILRQTVVRRPLVNPVLRLYCRQPETKTKTQQQFL